VNDAPQRTARTREEQLAVASRALSVPLLKLLDASLINAEDPAAGITIRVTEGALNAVDTLHAGAIATLLEITAYLALLPGLAFDEEAATHAFTASYLRAGHPGDDLRCTATVIRRSRRLAFVSAELTGNGELLATASVTKSILQSNQS
jgi:uncharacterized protein (TIGR00369 family)